MVVYKSEKRRYWESHIEKWRASGVSQVEYCRLNNVSIKSFRYWKRRVGRLGCAPALVELPLVKSAPVYLPVSSPQLCVVVDRYRVEIGKNFDAEDFERVLRVLGRI